MRLLEQSHAPPKPESTELSGGGTGRGPERDGDGIVQADFGWMAPVVGLLPARGAAHGVAEGSEELSPAHVCRRELERPLTDWWMRARTVGWLPAPRSGRERQGAQSSQGATELGFPKASAGEDAVSGGGPSGSAVRRGRRSGAGGSWWSPPAHPDRCARSSGPGCEPSPAPPARRRWQESALREDG